MKRKIAYGLILLVYIFVSAWFLYPSLALDKDWCLTNTSCEDDKCCLEAYK
jgi:type VI protein secretion system component VasK